MLTMLLPTFGEPSRPTVKNVEFPRLLLDFLMRRMLTVKRTILAELDALRLLLLIFGTRIIDTLALGTLEMDNFSHGANHSVQKPSTGLEPVASSLPRTCSTN